MQIKKVSLEKVIPLRHKILRKGRLLETCYFEDDNLEETFHLAAIEQDKIIGIATFIPKELKDFSGKQMQLRGMAVDESAQQKGVGKQIMHYAFELLLTEGFDLLWCNARETAANFYRKLAFTQLGESFDIPKVGIHYKMYKPLK